MNDSRSVKKVENGTVDTVGYPRCDDKVNLEACGDSSRRRFMQQLGIGLGAAGALSSLSLPGLAQSPPLQVDFSILDGHPDLGALSAAGPPPPEPVPGEALAAAAQGDSATARASAELSGASGVAAPSQSMVPAAAPPDDSSMGGAAGVSASGPDTSLVPSSRLQNVPLASGDIAQAAPTAEVIENRAMWVEPGYLVLLRWARPADNLDVVSSLEGAAARVGAYLSISITSREDLHDVDRLHTHEVAIADLLQGLLAPARILVLHLDHDCNTVCARFPIRVIEQDIPPIPGGMIAPSPPMAPPDQRR